MTKFLNGLIALFLLPIVWLWLQFLRCLRFALTTGRELLGVGVMLGGGYYLTRWLLTLDPTLGVPDLGVFVLLVWQIAKLYLSVALAHALFRLITPTLAEYTDTGDFSRDFSERFAETRAKLLTTLSVALVFFLAALTAMLFAP